MRTITFLASGTTGVAWVADKDCVLQGAQLGTTGSCHISTNPSLTTANYSTGTGFRSDVILSLSSATNTGTFPPQLKLAFPIRAGESIYLACSASGVGVNMFIEDISLNGPRGLT
jgi:hypothetical protein